MIIMQTNAIAFNSDCAFIDHGCQSGQTTQQQALSLSSTWRNVFILLLANYDEGDRDTIFPFVKIGTTIGGLKGVFPTLLPFCLLSIQGSLLCRFFIGFFVLLFNPFLDKFLVCKYLGLQSAYKYFVHFYIHLLCPIDWFVLQ